MASAKRVLIIDDEPDQVASLAALLRLSGHHVECATNPLYAIDLASQFHPQFVFLDIGLPYMSGYDVVRRLKKHFQGARMFAITGFYHRYFSHRTFDDHFAKPVDPAAIEKLLAS